MAKYVHILCYTCFTGASGLTIVTENNFFCYRIRNILLYCYNFHSDIYLRQDLPDAKVCYRRMMPTA